MNFLLQYDLENPVVGVSKAICLKVFLVCLDNSSSKIIREILELSVSPPPYPLPKLEPYQSNSLGELKKGLDMFADSLSPCPKQPTCLRCGQRPINTSVKR